jgi:hypothetical protein
MVRRKMNYGTLSRGDCRQSGRDVGQSCVTVERMIDKRPQADRLLVAQPTGTAQHHARWRELAGAGHAVAVAGLRELAAGRTSLLAEVAGTLEGFAEGELHEPQAEQAARLCRDAGADPDQVPAWIEIGRQQAARARQPQNASARGTLSSICIFATSAIMSLRSRSVMGVPANAR